MITMQEKITNWAKTAVEKYIELAKNGFDYAFYTQSDLTDIKESPNYFLCQINPGSGGKYSDQIKNPYWELNGKDMDAKHFIRGNYGVDTKYGNKKTAWQQRNKWANFRKLKSLFPTIEGKNPLDDDSKFVLTNATCFATPTTNKLIYKALEKTLPLTLELADIINPKRVIFLGSALPNYIEKIIDKDNNITYEIKDSKLPRIKYGSINNRETLFIDHPSAHTFKGDIKEVIRLWCTIPLEDAIKKAEEIRDNNPSIQKMSSLKVSQSKQKQLELIKALKNGHQDKGLEIFDKNDDKTIRFLLTTDLQITITANSSGYLAIRHTDFSGKCDKAKYFSDNKKLYDLLHNKFGFTHDSDVWIGCRPLNDFNDTDILFKTILDIKEAL